MLIGQQRCREGFWKLTSECGDQSKKKKKNCKKAQKQDVAEVLCIVRGSGLQLYLTYPTGMSNGVKNSSMNNTAYVQMPSFKRILFKCDLVLC